MKYQITFIVIFYFFESISGSKFGGNCSTNSTYCDDSSYCIDSQCKCPEGEEYLFTGLEYYSTKGECGLRVGSKCQHFYADDRCVIGSKCDEISKTCTCKIPSMPTPNGACTSVLNYACSASQPCTPGLFLDCIDGICQCSSSINMVSQVNRTIGAIECKAVAPGGKCSNNGLQFPTCVLNSECINETCQCIKGYGPTNNGPCEKMYLELCRPNRIDVCNSMFGLVCKSGSCVCSDESLHWDYEQESCVAKLGAPCFAINANFRHISCADSNASCQLPGKSMTEKLICKCNAGFKKNDKDVCVPDSTQSNCQCKENI